MHNDNSKSKIIPKNFRIIIFFVLTILIVGLATKLGDGESSGLQINKKKIDVPYVVVTDYFSTLTDFAPAENQGKQILIRQADKEGLSQLFSGLEMVNIEGEFLPTAGQIAVLPWYDVKPNMKTLSYNGKYPWKANDYDSYSLKIQKEVTDEEENKIAFDPAKMVKINFLGDIMLSRHVNTQMTRLGYDYPWEKVSQITADADITFANLEVPISDRYKVPASGMSFMASTKNLEYLKLAGIDVVSVANNHTANFGTQAFLDNLTNLQGAGIKICGGGLTEAEARKAVSFSLRGTNFNFLCQSAVVGSLYADGSSPGVPFLGLEPWYRRNQNSLDWLVADIEAGREDTVLIDSPHWGVEYKQFPNADQQMAAKLMIDNGVDLVMGTHPHVVQSLEYYKDVFTSYSLGNFVFDQEWSTETKQGVMASAYYYGDLNMAVQLQPIQIENYAQPSFVTGETATKIINDIAKNSVGF